MTITEDLLAEIEEAAIQTYQDEWYQDGPDIFTDTREQHCCGIPSAIHTGSVLHETMRAALGDQP